MSGLTVGTLVAVLQLRAEQFLAANRQAQAGLQATATEARTTATATERTDAAFTALGTSATRASAGLRDTTGAFIAAGAGADKATIANERLRAAQLQVIAAQERYDAVIASGTATDGEKAAAEARLSAAQTRVAVTANQAAEAMARQGAAATAAAAETEAAAAKQSAAATRTVSGVAGMIAKTGALLGGVALVFSVAEIAKNGNEFTHAMNTLAAASGGTAEQLAAARTEAIAMGKDLTIPKVTATDAAVAMEDLVKAGVHLDRAMSAARPALLLAAAANVDVADSARVTGDLLDEWGFSADHATHVADVMATAANSAGGGLMDLFGAMKYVGPSARQLGVGFDYTTASLVELAKAGIQGSLAGTSLRNMLTRLSPQGAPATAAITALGVSAFDATGKFRGLPVVVDQLHAAAERLSPQAFAANVSIAFGARALSAVQIFAHGGSAALQTFYDKLESGSVQEFADKMNRGVGAGFSQLGKEFSAVGLDIYNAVQGPVADAVFWIGDRLPKAFEAGKAFIGDLASDARSVLAPAWTAVSAVFRTSVGVISDVFGFLGHHEGTLKVIAETAGAMYLAFKGYTVLTAAAAAIRLFAATSATSLSGSAMAVREWGANWASVMAGTGTSAELASAAVTAALAEEGAALAAVAAQADAALAAEAASWEELGAAAQSAAVFVMAAAEESAAAVQVAAGAAQAAAIEMDAAGAEAAVGWGSLLGPIGLVAVALTVVGAHFLGAGSKARTAAIGVDAFTDAIGKDSGALGANTRAAIANQLAKDGAFKAADKLGIGTDVLTDAVLHGGSAMAQLKAHLTDVASAYNATTQGANAAGMTQKELTDYTHSLDAAFGGSGKAANDLLAELNGVSGGLTQAQQNAKDMTTALGPTSTAAQATAAQVQELQGVLGGLAGASDTTSISLAKGFAASLAEASAQDALQASLSGTKTAAEGLTTALDALNDDLNADQAQNSFLDTLDQLTQGLKDNGASIDQASAKGRANRETLEQGVVAAQQAAIAQSKLTGNVQDGINTYQKNIDQLFAQAAAAGVNKQSLDELRAAVVNLPELKQILVQAQTAGADAAVATTDAKLKGLPNPNLKINVDANQAIKNAQAVRDQMNQVTDKYVTIHVSQTGLSAAQANARLNDQASAFRAAGGLVTGPGTPTSDSIPARLSNREFVQQASAVNKFGVPFMAAVNHGDTAKAMALLAHHIDGGNTATAGPAAASAAVRTVQQTNYITAGWEARETDAYLSMLAGVS